MKWPTFPPTVRLSVDRERERKRERERDDYVEGIMVVQYEKGKECAAFCTVETALYTALEGKHQNMVILYKKYEVIVVFQAMIQYMKMTYLLPYPYV